MPLRSVPSSGIQWKFRFQTQEAPAVLVRRALLRSAWTFDVALARRGGMVLVRSGGPNGQLNPTEAAMLLQALGDKLEKSPALQVLTSST